jgi:hypothetical protein
MAKIREHGKFEGQEQYAQHFYGVGLNGWGQSVETVDGLVEIHDVQDDDVELWPELKGKSHVAFLHSAQGFYEEVEVPDDDEIEEWSREFARANGEEYEGEDEESDDDYPRPTEDDLAESYVISDGRRGGYDVVKPGGKKLDHFGDFDEAVEEIMERSEKEKYFANIYYVNDHGNIDLLDEKGKIVKSWV